MTDGIVRLNHCAKSARWFLILTPLLFLAAGCHRDDVKVYHVATNQDQMSAQAAPALPAGHPNIVGDAGLVPNPPPFSDAPLTWKTPEGWTQVPPSEMRVASFKVAGKDGKQADVSVIPLQGMAGTDEANVNRWRGQVGLQLASADALRKSAENIEAGGQSAQLYDLAGQNPGSGETSRILGVIQHRDNAAWFYKMTGDADLVEQQKPAFVQFLKSLNFTAATAPAELPPGHPAINNENPPAGFPGAAMTPAPTTGPISHEGQPNWQVPAGWQEVSGGQFLVAKFMLAGSGGATAAVNVSMSAGDGGGLDANVNRWRGQLGLAPSPDALTTPIVVAGGNAPLVNMSGTDARTGKPAQLVGVMVSQSGHTWFYKLMGDPDVVAQQKDALIQFVQSAKYP